MGNQSPACLPPPPQEKMMYGTVYCTYVWIGLVWSVTTRRQDESMGESINQSKLLYCTVLYLAAVLLETWRSRVSQSSRSRSRSRHCPTFLTPSEPSFVALVGNMSVVPSSIGCEHRRPSALRPPSVQLTSNLSVEYNALAALEPRPAITFSASNLIVDVVVCCCCCRLD